MSLLNREPSNPLLKPDPKTPWQSYAAFNGSIVKDGDTYHLFYRAISNERDYEGKHMRLSVVGKAVSRDGITFSDSKPFIEPKEEWEKYGCEDPRVTKIDDTYFICYTAISEYPPGPSNIRCAVAITKDLNKIEERHLVTPFNAKAMTFFPKKINGKYAALLTANTDIPPAKIGLALFDSLEQIWSPEYWREWYMHLEDHLVPLQRMNSYQIEVGATPIETEHGWLFVFANIKNYYTEAFREFLVEAVLLDKENPQKVIGRVHESLIAPEAEYELKGTVQNIVFPSGGIVEDGMFHLYYGAADTTTCRASIKLEDLLKKMQTQGVVPPRMKKYEGNPILEPIGTHMWETQAVFNPAALYDGEKVRILYRAQSDDFTSTIGYAVSADGLHIDERDIVPIYLPRAEFEDKKKEGVGSGCEDPRVTVIDDTVYMCYTAYNGEDVPRVALTSLSFDDFKNRRWVWKDPVLISPPGIDDKDACVLSEKVKGKYVIFHRIDNDIVLDYVDSLDQFDGKNTWLRTIDYIPLREDGWDEEKVGIAGPPISTEKGWLLLYHGVSKVDHHYRVGAMLLDKDNPSKVISRLNYPLLEPETQFEREGLVPNVVFPCGSVVKDGTIFTYYGGADKVVCVATIGFDDLLNYLWDKREVKYLI